MSNSNKDWKTILTQDEYRVMREKGTELPFSGKYNIHNDEGVYRCKGCSEPLFLSGSKFDADCGWPSFDNEIAQGKVKKVLDKTHGMIRSEIICAKCDSHLGHIFNDGPTESGLRYCVNSICLNFENKK